MRVCVRVFPHTPCSCAAYEQRLLDQLQPTCEQSRLKFAIGTDSDSRAKMFTKHSKQDGPVNLKLLDLSLAPYGLYGVKYIDLVSLGAARPVNLKFYHRPFVSKFLQAKSGFGMCFDIGSQHLGCPGQNTSPHAQGCDLS